MANTNYGYRKLLLWQWVIIYLVVGGLIYAAVYAFYLKPQDSTTIPEPTPAKATITPSDKAKSALTPSVTNLTISAGPAGFTPQSLTIKTGDTVTWTNNDTANIMVDSSPHPAHTDYPPLNLGLIKPGKSKSLMFPTSGTYRFHDHLAPTHFGSIIVQ